MVGYAKNFSFAFLVFAQKMTILERFLVKYSYGTLGVKKRLE